MPKQDVMAREYSLWILKHAEKHHQRTGQYLFNSLPQEAGAVIVGTVFDPFHKDMSQYQVEDWLLHHAIFNDNESIVAIFNNNDMLWERE
jgi:hypothetical protein